MTMTETVAKSGRKPPAVRGNRKGVPNKVTADLKNMILTALSNAGGAEYLERKANDPRTASAFLGLVGKVLPMTVANEPGKEFLISVIERRIVNAQD